MNQFNWPLFFVIMFVFVLPTAGTRLALELLRWRRERKGLPSPTSYTFTSSDNGRTWYDADGYMSASPFTDKLQDYYDWKNGRQLQ